MAPSNGTQERQLRQPRQSCVPMAPSNGTQKRQQQWRPQERQLRQPRQKSDPPIAPSNRTHAATTTSPKLRPNGAQQWHPGTAAAMAPTRNGSYDNLAKVASQWHPAMAPRNGSQDNLTKVASQWRPASNGTQERQQQWRPGTAAAMAPRNGRYDNLAKSLTQQWHPGTAATTTSPKLRPNGTQQWHPGTAACNGTQERQLRQPRQKSDPPIAPSNGAQERQLRQPRQSCVPMAPSNGAQERQQQWHPGTAATTTSPKV